MHKQSYIPHLVYNIAYKATMGKFFLETYTGHTDTDIFSTRFYLGADKIPSTKKKKTDNVSFPGLATSNGKTSIVCYRTLSFFALRF